MRKMTSVFVAALSFGAIVLNTVSAQSVDEATTLFGARLADKENALKAADMYKTLSDASEDNVVKGNLKVKESQALYYYSGRLTDSDTRKALYIRGYQAADAAKDLLKTGGSDADVALSYYFYAINLAKWGQVNGIASSIGRLREVVGNLEKVVELDKSVEEFGAARTLGRLKHKVPSILAIGLDNWGKDNALKEYTNAFNSTRTVVPGTTLLVSKNSTTTVYLLDLLAALKKDADFCRYYRGAITLAKAGDEVLAQVNPDKVAEQRNDYNGLVACVENKKVCNDYDFESGETVHELAKKCR